MDSMDIDPDIAAQMGFSSFGSIPKHPNKKQKPNPAQSSISQPSNPNIGRGSSSRGARGGRGTHRGRGNHASQTMHLPSARLDHAEGINPSEEDPGYVSGTPPPSKPTRLAAENPDEIALDLSDDDDEDTEVVANLPRADVTSDAKFTKEANLSSDAGNVHQETTASGETASRETTSMETAPGETASRETTSNTEPAQTSAGSLTTPKPSAPSRPWPASHADREGKNPDGSWNWDALGRGIRNADGDMVYFNHTFIEDPWAGLLNADGT